MIALNPHIKKSLKSIVERLLGNHFVAKVRIARACRLRRLTIVNLHRIASHDGSTYSPLSIDNFRTLLFFLREFYTIISFSDISDHQDLDTAGRPLLILSFDDGYLDFFENACPILAEYNIRVNQNIIPWCVENQRPPLNVSLQDFIGKNQDYAKQICIPGFVFSGDQQQDGLLLSKFIKNRSISEQFNLRNEVEDQGIDLTQFETRMMGIDEVRKISSSHEIGSHTYFHSNMSHETDNFFRLDILKCDEWFTRNLGFSPNIFAFPNSDYSTKNLDILCEYNFNHILLVDDKFSKCSRRIHFRFGVHFDSIYSMRFQSTGKLLA